MTEVYLGHPGFCLNMIFTVSIWSQMCIAPHTPTADNGPQKSAEKNHFLSNQGSDQGEVVTGTISKEENAAPGSSRRNVVSSAMTIIESLEK
jgi:hypothetical protein